MKIKELFNWELILSIVVVNIVMLILIELVVTTRVDFTTGKIHRSVAGIGDSRETSDQPETATDSSDNDG